MAYVAKEFGYHSATLTCQARAVFGFLTLLNSAEETFRDFQNEKYRNVLPLLFLVNPQFPCRLYHFTFFHSLTVVQRLHTCQRRVLVLLSAGCILGLL